jgi:hypothetical protein
MAAVSKTNSFNKIDPDKLEPSTKYMLLDGSTLCRVLVDETGTKFTIQPSRVLGLITNDKRITFDIPYLVSQNFFAGANAAHFFEVNKTEGVES